MGLGMRLCLNQLHIFHVGLQTNKCHTLALQMESLGLTARDVNELIDNKTASN